MIGTDNQPHQLECRNPYFKLSDDPGLIDDSEVHS